MIFVLLKTAFRPPSSADVYREIVSRIISTAAPGIISQWKKVFLNGLRGAPVPPEPPRGLLGAC